MMCDRVQVAETPSIGQPGASSGASSQLARIPEGFTRVRGQGFGHLPGKTPQAAHVLNLRFVSLSDGAHDGGVYLKSLVGHAEAERLEDKPYTLNATSWTLKIGAESGICDPGKCFWALCDSWRQRTPLRYVSGSDHGASHDHSP